ncbi:MAG: hypothetical protein IT430_11545 [Phycisphaerales bacterium]|nr:hypothetical protein [Phycisphaerales bacterium]
MQRSDTQDELLRLARVCVRTDAESTVVRLAESSAFMSFVAWLIGLGLLGCLVYVGIAAVLPSHQVPLPWVAIEVIIVIGVSVAMGYRRHLTNESGEYDLIIDRVSASASLPRSCGRVDRVLLPLASISAIVPAEEFARHDTPMLSDETFGPKVYKPLRLVVGEPVRDFGHRQNICFGVVIVWRDDDGRERLEAVARWYDHPRANAFAHWLSMECGVPVPCREHRVGNASVTQPTPNSAREPRSSRPHSPKAPSGRNSDGR